MIRLMPLPWPESRTFDSSRAIEMREELRREARAHNDEETNTVAARAA